MSNSPVIISGQDPNSEDNHLPDKLTRDFLESTFKDFMDEDKYDSDNFWAFFGDSRAEVMLPFDSLLDLVKNSVCYDDDNNFDVRILRTVIHDKDQNLFVSLISQVGERFVGKPAGPLTLYQFKAMLARRMASLGF